jgi:Lrp/AsnC family transcriptional regulator for asnA, asnC and gidA
MQKLQQMGVIKGSQYLFDAEKVGNGTCAFVGLLLKDPSDSDRVVEQLKLVPEVVECHYTTGDYDLFIKLYAHDNAHLLSIIHNKLQHIGIQRSETMVSFHEPINRQMPINTHHD